LRTILKIALLAIMAVACQKEEITIGTNVSDTFYLDNKGASMRVLVEGNTASGTFLVIVHGGPGGGAYIYNTDYISNHIEDKFAVVYWDQRNAGASQGNNNGKNLTLSKMTNDLKKVIETLKARYGQNSEVFILGHSFGGMIAASFMTQDTLRSMVNGWIMADASHNYPLNNRLTREMLLNLGREQMDANLNTEKWEPIISWCLAHPSINTMEEAKKLESFASDAENLFPEVKHIGFSDFTGLIVKEDWAVTSMLFNYLYSKHADINENLEKTGFSTLLYKINKPTLLLWGKYDFVCPSELGTEIFNRIDTNEKQFVVSSKAGHAIMFQDPEFFCDKINTFIYRYR